MVWIHRIILWSQWTMRRTINSILNATEIFWRCKLFYCLFYARYQLASNTSMLCIDDNPCGITQFRYSIVTFCGIFIVLRSALAPTQQWNVQYLIFRRTSNDTPNQSSYIRITTMPGSGRRQMRACDIFNWTEIMSFVIFPCFGSMCNH